MRFKCPGCQNRIELHSHQAGERVVCPYCRMALKGPAVTILAVPDPTPPSDPPGAPAIVPVPPPTVYPRAVAVPIPDDSWEDREEERADRRDRREDRALSRRERGEDRHEERIDREERRRTNPQGMTGFACSATAFLAMLGGIIFQASSESKAYLCLTTTVSFPLALTGLVSSLVGLGARREASKVFAVIGALLGAFLLLVVLPLAVVSLQNSSK